MSGRLFLIALEDKHFSSLNELIACFSCASFLYLLYLLYLDWWVGASLTLPLSYPNTFRLWVLQRWYLDFSSPSTQPCPGLLWSCFLYLSEGWHEFLVVVESLGGTATKSCGLPSTWAVSRGRCVQWPNLRHHSAPGNILALDIPGFQDFLDCPKNYCISERGSWERHGDPSCWPVQISHGRMGCAEGPLLGETVPTRVVVGQSASFP